MAPLFSKVVLNKLWHDVQNEETLICAKFGNDLFNISKVIGRKKVAQFFFDSQCSNFTMGPLEPQHKAVTCLPSMVQLMVIQKLQSIEQTHCEKSLKLQKQLS